MTTTPPRRVRIHPEGSREYAALEKTVSSAPFPAQTLVISYDQRCLFLRWLSLLAAIGFALTAIVFAVGDFHYSDGGALPARVTAAPVIAALVSAYGFHIMSSARLRLAFTPDTLIVHAPRPAGLGFHTAAYARSTINDVIMQRQTTNAGPYYRVHLRLYNNQTVPLVRHEQNKTQAAWLERLIATWLGLYQSA